MSAKHKKEFTLSAAEVPKEGFFLSVFRTFALASELDLPHDVDDAGRAFVRKTLKKNPSFGTSAALSVNSFLCLALTK